MEPGRQGARARLARATHAGSAAFSRMARGTTAAPRLTSFEAPPGCPSRERFVADVARRTRTRTEERGEEPSFAVRIEQVAPGRHRGRLAVERTPDGTSERVHLPDARNDLLLRLRRGVRTWRRDGNELRRNSLVMCNAGKIAKIDCTSLGFAGRKAWAKGAICSTTPATP